MTETKNSGNSMPIVLETTAETGKDVANTTDKCINSNYTDELEHIAKYIISLKDLGIEGKKELIQTLIFDKCIKTDCTLILEHTAKYIISSEYLEIEEKKEFLAVIFDKCVSMEYVGVLGYITTDILESENLEIEEKEEFLIYIIDTCIRVDTEVSLGLAEKIIDKMEKIIDKTRDKLSEEKEEHFIKQRLDCLKKSVLDEIESKPSPNEVQLEVIELINSDMDKIIDSMKQKHAKEEGKLFKY